MRVRWVDYAKGIGILLVVLGHILRGLNDAGFKVPLFSYIDQVIYGFHMPLFFLLSGLFVGRWTERPFKIAISQKATQLLRPYLIWSLIQGGVMIVLSGVTNGNSLTWSNLGYKIAVLPFGQFWFIYTLFFAFILYYGLMQFFSLRKIGLIALGFYLIAPLFEGMGELEALGVNYLYFTIGAMVYSKIQEISRFVTGKRAVMITVLFVVINLLYVAIPATAYDFVVYLYQLIVAIFGVVFIIMCSEWLAQRNRLNVLGMLGRNSMSIYLLHILAASGTRIILSNVLHVDHVGVHIIAGLLCGIILPMIGYSIASKIKMEKFLFSYELQKTSQTAKSY